MLCHVFMGFLVSFLFMHPFLAHTSQVFGVWGDEMVYLVSGSISASIHVPGRGRSGWDRYDLGLGWAGVL